MSPGGDINKSGRLPLMQYCWPSNSSALLGINGNTHIIMQIKVNQSHWKTRVQSN